MPLTRARRELTAAVTRRSAALLRAVETRVGLTASGLGVGAATLVLFVLARTTSSRALFMLSYGGVVVLALAALLARRRLALTSERSTLPTRVRAGQPITVTLRLHARRGLGTVVVEERLPPRLGGPVVVPLSALTGGDAVHEYAFTPALRGVYGVGPLVARWSDPFGLTRREVVLCPPVSLIVHPRTEPARDRVLAREWEDPPLRPPVTKPWPSGYEFYGLRDYVSGDDPRRIVWRATARSLDLNTGEGRYLVRESEQGITDRVTVLLDTDRAAHSPGEVSETFETAVRVVASLAAQHVRTGFTVTAVTNSARLHRPVRSPREAIRLLDQLASLQTSGDRLVRGLERLVRDPRRDAHIVVVTPYLDAAATGRLQLLTDRGVSVVLVLLQWDEMDPLTQHRAGQLRCPIVEVSSTSSLEGAFAHVISHLVLR